ncbi:CotO family spore coat protein [Neobacillus fumarioli]|uniref:CotO family spore coat protein n=1 Tax=Neobacillus fumarioli TaxID=105229 RepID=UPI0008303EAF|nr:CotO family spore coat protein [Neobacillus fumarioli]
MSNNRSQGPLLYIDQPFSRPPAALNMQEVYTNKSELKQSGFEQMLEPKGKRKTKKGEQQEPVQMELSNQPPDEAVSHQEKRHSSFKRVKPFREMNLTERLEYLLHFPKALPPVPCIFYTADQNHQGYLANFADDQVTIQFPDQTTITIPVSQLNNVMMIGIKS